MRKSFFASPVITVFTGIPADINDTITWTSQQIQIDNSILITNSMLIQQHHGCNAMLADYADTNNKLLGCVGKWILHIKGNILVEIEVFAYLF